MIPQFERDRRRLNADRRRRRLSEARLFLFEPATTTAAGRAVLALIGEVAGGWDVIPRFLDRTGTPVPMSIVVTRSDAFTPSVAKRVAGFAIVYEGETDGVIENVDPAAKSKMPFESVQRYFSRGETNQRYDIGTGGGFITSEGDLVIWGDPPIESFPYAFSIELE